MTELPPLPETVYSILGPITVEVVETLQAEDGEDCFGLWRPWEWKIGILADVPLVVQWMTLKHEWIHATLWCAGTKVPTDVEERLCDALGSGMVAEMLNG